MTSEHSCTEPEVGVKFCMINFSKLVYCKVVTWCGHRGFRPALVNSVYVYVFYNYYIRNAMLPVKRDILGDNNITHSASLPSAVFDTTRNALVAEKVSSRALRCSPSWCSADRLLMYVSIADHAPIVADVLDVASHWHHVSSSRSWSFYRKMLHYRSWGSVMGWQRSAMTLPNNLVGWTSRNWCRVRIKIDCRHSWWQSFVKIMFIMLMLWEHWNMAY